jgi:hypothetical protein
MTDRPSNEILLTPHASGAFGFVETKPKSLFDAFSSREPVSTPDRVRGRPSLENALGRAAAPRLALLFGICIGHATGVNTR